MNPALAWIKSNLLIVIFLVVILLVLPAAYVGSDAWGTSIRTDQEKKAVDALNKVNASRVDYSIPQYDPASPALTEKAVPNKAKTDWYKLKREEFATAAGIVAKKAEEFNKGAGADAAAVGRTEHKPIVEGLFPGAHAQAEAELKQERGEEAWTSMPEADRHSLVNSRAKSMIQERVYAAEEAFLGKRGRPNPYRELLTKIRAGGPADAIRLVEDVKTLKTAEVQKIGQKRDLTPDEAQKLAKLLEERRLGGYQSRAKDISVFATVECFPTDDKLGSAIRLDSFDAREIDPYHFFIYQWDLWLLSDMTSSVALANRAADGRPTNVDQSIVKRLISITMKEPHGLLSGGTVDPITGAAATPPTSAVPGLVPLDPQVSLTARGMGSWNTFYDLRESTMTCVVSSARVPDFIAAIERTNFMTVTNIEISGVNVWEDLKAGYYYGPEHVVKVKVDIESVWLRSWMTAYMPPDVQSVLGVPGAAPVESAPSGTPDAAAAPIAPRGAPMGGSRGMKGMKGPG